MTGPSIPTGERAQWAQTIVTVLIVVIGLSMQWAQMETRLSALDKLEEKVDSTYRTVTTIAAQREAQTRLREFEEKAIEQLQDRVKNLSARVRDLENVAPRVLRRGAE